MITCLGMWEIILKNHMGKDLELEADDEDHIQFVTVSVINTAQIC